MPPRKPKPENAQGPRFKWIGTDAADAAKRRFYRLETLASATEGAVRTERGPLFAAAESVLGRVPFTSFVCEFVSESPYRLVFRVSITNARQKRATLMYVAAKNERELAKLLEIEWGNMVSLAKRAPRHVPQPLRPGTLFLPDRHRRKEMERNVFCYVSQWSGTTEELGTGRGSQFVAMSKPPRVLSKPVSEGIREALMEMAICAYDPTLRIGIDMGALSPADLWFATTKQGAPRLWLGACRRVEHRLTPEKLLHRLIHASWGGGPDYFPLAPGDAQAFVDVVLRTAGPELGPLWLARYRDAVAANKIGPPPPGYALLLES
jgi:hypothetical protein